MKLIPLTQGKFAEVDNEDYDRVIESGYSWYANKHVKSGREYWYVKAYSRVRNGKREWIYLHRFILDAPKGIEVDHINGDRFDNRRSNLRLATRKQNCANRKLNVNSTTGCKGVTKRKNRGKYEAEIMYDGGKCKYLGSYQNSKEAAIAYNKAAEEIFGEFARLNTV